MSRIKPRTQAPPLAVETLDHGRWTLADRHPDAFTMIVFYRGLHCPVCRGYLRDLDRRAEAFRAQGVDLIAVSGDTEERARSAQRQWGIASVPIGYGLDEATMRAWGLFVSRGIGPDEPGLFNEPGLFLIRPDGTVYYEALTSMPFGRPSLGEVLESIRYATTHAYPARGEA